MVRRLFSMHFIRRFFVLFLIVVCARLGAQQHNLTIFIDPQDTLSNKIFSQCVLNGKTTLDSESLTQSLFYALHQRASPILCINGHIFEHIILRMIGFQKRIKASSELQTCYKKILLGKKMLSDAINSQQIHNNDLYNQFRQLCYDVQATKEFDTDLLFDFACCLLFKNLNNHWFIYRYNHCGAPHYANAYLLIPLQNTSAQDNQINHDEIIKSHGLNPQFFTLKPLQAISQEIVSARGYSHYVSSVLPQDKADNGFSAGVMEILNKIFLVTGKESRSLCVIGHGNIGCTPGTKKTIIGLNEKVFFEEFLPFIVRNNVYHAFLNSCEIGGIYRDRIQTEIDKFKSKYGEQFRTTIILGGMPDCKTTIIGPLIIPIIDENNFYQVLSKFQPDDQKALDVLPFFQSLRFDKYFAAFDFVQKQRIQPTGFLEQFLASEISQSSSMINQVIRSIVPFYCYKNSFLSHCTPQILTPDPNTLFKPVEFDSSVAVISNDDESQLDTVITNKKILVVEPQRVNSPLIIQGCLPQILSMRSGNSVNLFESMHVESSECLQSILEQMFFAEKDQRSFARAFWIKKFKYGHQEIQNLIVGFEDDERSVYYQKKLGGDEKPTLFYLDLENKNHINFHDSSQEAVWFYNNLRSLSNLVHI